MLLNLKEFRRQKGYTQKEFAKLFEIGRIAYVKLENGQIEIKKKHMDKILELFPNEDINVMKLFEDVKRG